MENYITENNLKTLFNNAKKAIGNNVVIRESVTDRINTLQEKSFSEIMSAGKSGLTEKKGIVKNDYNLYFSDGYTGKMTGKVGLSGYAGNNPECIKRALLGYGICRHCFSFLTPWMNSIKAWTKNDLILSSVIMEKNSVIIDSDKIPSMRFSSHGDTINDIHLYNYLRIAADNPNTEFALWTKNVRIFRDGLKLFGKKPENIIIGFSPIAMNVIPSPVALKKAKNIGFDFIFGVNDTYTNQEKSLQFGGYKCHCGTNSCHGTCQFCYSAKKRHELGYNMTDSAVYISEILDGERHKE